MKTEIQLDLPELLIRGDGFDINCVLNFNLEDYKIRAELYDQFYASIRRATENSGGSDDQIEIIDEDDGTFVIHIDSNTTNLFHLISYLEIEVENESGLIQTVYFSPIKFVNDLRPTKWVTP